MVTAICLISAFAAVPASANHGTFNDEAFLAVGTGPLWWEGLGITEQANCDAGSDLQGIDGVWYDLEAEGISGTGHDFFLTTDDPMDVDALFYDADCGQVEVVGACWIESGVDLPILGNCQEESGAIPDDAEFLLIQNFLGSGTYQLTIS